MIAICILISSHDNKQFAILTQKYFSLYSLRKIKHILLQCASLLNLPCNNLQYMLINAVITLTFVSLDNYYAMIQQHLKIKEFCLLLWQD